VSSSVVYQGQEADEEFSSTKGSDSGIFHGSLKAIEEQPSSEFNHGDELT
jgi:hypothetical protein